MKLRFTKNVLQCPKIGDWTIKTVRKLLQSLEDDKRSHSMVEFESIRQKAFI